MTDDDPTTLRLVRVVPADRERVWRAWTEEWATWMWPERFEATVELEARPGAAYRLASEVAGMAVVGVVVAAEPPSRLVLTWLWEGEPEETLVTVGLREVAGGTEIELVHERHTARQQRDDHAEGWGHCLGRLEGLLMPRGSAG